MTQPTVIYFGADTSADEPPHVKVFLRTILYATAVRGCIIESMFVRLWRRDTMQSFTVWVYGDGSLSRGSGLFVPAEGITTNHHFLLPHDHGEFAFLPGEYTVQVIASLVGERKPRILKTIEGLTVSPGHAAALARGKQGIYFDWSPDSIGYRSHLRSRDASGGRDRFSGLIGDLIAGEDLTQ